MRFCTYDGHIHVECMPHYCYVLILSPTNILLTRFNHLPIHNDASYTCEQKNDPSIESFIHVGHCNFDGLPQPAVSQIPEQTGADIFLLDLSRRH